MITLFIRSCHPTWTKIRSRRGSPLHNGLLVGSHPSCHSPNISRCFALHAHCVCLAGETPTCSVPALCRDARVYGRTSTAMHENSKEYPPRPSPKPAQSYSSTQPPTHPPTQAPIHPLPKYNPQEILSVASGLQSPPSMRSS